MPIRIAWHADMDGWFEGHQVKCHACTAMQEDPSKPVIHRFAVDIRPADDRDLSPFVLGVTTADS